ncbi:MAG TPA: hypothetical protein VIH71_07005 [Solirubrobacteraceae bacterium]
MRPHFLIPPTALAGAEREQHLIDLLRRLLRCYDDLRAENKHLRKLLNQLAAEHRMLREQYARSQDDHAIEATAADVMLGAALGGTQGQPAA